MEKFDVMYDNLTGIYNELESMMSSVYEELQSDPTNVDKENFLHGLGSVALKVISSQMQLIDEYCELQYKDNLLLNWETKDIQLREILNLDKNKVK